MSSYRWVQPKAMKGEAWWFRDHPRLGGKGAKILGKVMMVETHYESSGKAYHLYHMQVRHYVRRRIVGEESLDGREYREFPA